MANETAKERLARMLDEHIQDRMDRNEEKRQEGIYGDGMRGWQDRMPLVRQ